MNVEQVAEAAGSSDELARVVLNDGVYSDALCCCWRSWRVVGPRALAVDLPEGNCTDMDGAIRVAEVLMPGVREIHTFCDQVAGMIYSCVGGTWQAFESAGNQSQCASSQPLQLGLSDAVGAVEGARQPLQGFGSTADQCRALGIAVGDTIEGRETAGPGYWHEARLTLVWLGDDVAVWRVSERSSERLAWSEPEEHADWTLECRQWRKVSA